MLLICGFVANAPAEPSQLGHSKFVLKFPFLWYLPSATRYWTRCSIEEHRHIAQHLQVHQGMVFGCREAYAYERKIRRARNKQNSALAEQLASRRPSHRLDHLVRERCARLSTKQTLYISLVASPVIRAVPGHPSFL